MSTFQARSLQSEVAGRWLAACTTGNRGAALHRVVIAGVAARPAAAAECGLYDAWVSGFKSRAATQGFSTAPLAAVALPVRVSAGRVKRCDRNQRVQSLA